MVHTCLLSVAVMTVCLRDGATRSGLVCALNYVLEQLKVEHDVDVFQSVRHVRINRPQIIPAFVSACSLTLGYHITVVFFIKLKTGLRPRMPYGFLFLSYSKSSSSNVTFHILLQ